MAKRCLDVFGALFGFVIFSPVMLLAAMAIRLSGPGPIVFRQVRVGVGGKPFFYYKFRTMRTGADLQAAFWSTQSRLRVSIDELPASPAYKLMQDPRITPIGRLLRKTSIDELPQLLNVMKGDMSLVGPRPPLPYEVEHYRPEHMQRLTVKPGITGLWQVSGRGVVTFDEMVQMDLDYAQRQSLLLDLKILLRTLAVVATADAAA